MGLSLNRCRIMLTSQSHSSLTMRNCTDHKLWAVRIRYIFQKFMYKIRWQSRWGDDIINSLICILHIDWSRKVLCLICDHCQNVITSLFFNQFSSGFHCLGVQKILLFLLKFMLNAVSGVPLLRFKNECILSSVNIFILANDSHWADYVDCAKVELLLAVFFFFFRQSNFIFCIYMVFNDYGYND